MKPPIPEVPPLAPPQGAKSAPLGLNLWLVLSLASLVFYLLFYPRDPAVSRLEAAISDGIIIVLSLLSAYFVWRGANWARLVTLYLTALVLPLYFLPADVLGEFASKSPPLLHWFDAALCVFTLIYFNLPAVKAHFKAPKSLK